MKTSTRWTCQPHHHLRAVLLDLPMLLHKVELTTTIYTLSQVSSASEYCLLILLSLLFVHRLLQLRSGRCSMRRKLIVCCCRCRTESNMSSCMPMRGCVMPSMSLTTSTRSLLSVGVALSTCFFICLIWWPWNNLLPMCGGTMIHYNRWRNWKMTELPLTVCSSDFENVCKQL